jgi:hypothetical protein
MPVTLVCPICDKEHICEGPHGGPQTDDLHPVGKCPLTKGSLYIFVKDDAGNGIPGVHTSCEGAPVGKGPTLKQGFAYYEQLEAGPYPTAISLEQSDVDVQTNYYCKGRFAASGKVEKGQITIVEYVLQRYAELLATVQRDDGSKELPKVSFEVVSDSHVLEKAVQDAVEGQGPYSKLKPTSIYNVACKIVDEEGRKNFTLVEASKPNVSVDPGKRQVVEFVLKRRHWVEVSLTDSKDPDCKGSFKIHPEQADAKVETGVGRDVRHVPDLPEGKVNIESVDIDVSRVFVGMS